MVIFIPETYSRNSYLLMRIFTSSYLQTKTFAWPFAVVQRLSLLHNFIQQSLNSGSAQARILLEACRRLAMVRISEIRLYAFRRSAIPQKQFIIIIIIIIIKDTSTKSSKLQMLKWPWPIQKVLIKFYEVHEMAKTNSESPYKVLRGSWNGHDQFRKPL